MKFAQCFCVLTGLLIVHGSLGLSDQEQVSLAGCLLRCGVGLSLMVGGIWLPKLFPRKRKAKNFHSALIPLSAQQEEKNGGMEHDGTRDFACFKTLGSSPLGDCHLYGLH